MQNEQLIAIVRDALQDGNAENIRESLDKLLLAFEKNIHRLDKITKQSDKQQNQLLKLNDDLEQAYEELNEYKNNLEIRVEQETKKRLEQEKILMQNAKMAEMGSMLGAIIHQWKQPITIIGMISDLMSRDLDDGNIDVLEMKNSVATVKNRIMFLSHTIDDFRNFFKPDKEPKDFNPKVIAEEVLKIIEHQILKYNATVKIQGMDDAITSGFPNEIKHVILNLVNNALEASAENKSGASESPCIILDISQNNNETVLRISDNGGGIPEHIMKNLFMAYNSSKGDAGTGIGLTLAKTIIEEHHKGKISAKNTDIGAEFTVAIPHKK